VIAVGRGDLTEEGIERIVQKIELSTSPYSESAAQSFKLAELEAAADGTWSLHPGYVPPLMQIGTSPFFDPYLDRMNAIARTLRQVLMGEIQENYLAADNQVAAKQCLRGLFAFHAMLVDLGGEIHHHPYALFAALRALYLEVCVFRDVQPTAMEKSYSHEDIAGSFDGLLAGIEEQVQINKQKIPYTEFVRREGMLISTLAKDVKRAKEVFLLVQKPQVSTTLDLSRVKLASESRIHTVYERALRGIPYHRLDNPPFHHGLSATVEFFAIAPGQEWDYALREGKIVLFDAPQLQGARLYLYWRVE
jgi:type VI secretion system protein ImpJ